MAIGVALLLAAGCWAFGTWVARTVGLLEVDAPVGREPRRRPVPPDSWSLPRGGPRSGRVGGARSPRWPSASRSRSPLAVVEQSPGANAGRPLPGTRSLSVALTTRRRQCGRPSRRYVIPAVLAGVFIVAVALFYGSTIALSPRDGVQPIIERDTAYYAILGRDLASTGTETNLGPFRILQTAGLPGSDLVSLGRGLACIVRDRDLRDRAHGRPALYRPADRAPRGGRPGRHACPTSGRDELPARLPVRRVRAPRPRS